VAVSNNDTVRRLPHQDMEVIVKYLSRDKQHCVIEKEVIKLVDDLDSREVTVVDHGVLEMKSAILKLEAQIDEMQARIERFAF
jgi:charged multivesicular body protein 7